MSNVEMPRFAAASGQGVQSSDWGEIDNLDVDMLAEYLLDDGNLTSNVVFDFKYVPFLDPSDSKFSLLHLFSLDQSWRRNATDQLPPG